MKKLQHRLRYTQLAQLLPNLVTISALCSGLSAIRFALMGRWEGAVILIIIAAILDGMDGKIARLLKVDSHFGAELDSLSDFISFGVAPSIVLYLYSLHHWAGIGWAVVLFFSTCQALRLARFNTKLIKATPAPEWTNRYFIGVPAPAGAILSLTPLMLSFALEIDFSPLPFVFAVYMIGSALLMASAIPTFALKNIRLPTRYVLTLFIVMTIYMAAFFSAPWWTLTTGTMIYLFSIPFSLNSYRQKKRLEPSHV